MRKQRVLALVSIVSVFAMCGYAEAVSGSSATEFRKALQRMAAGGDLRGLKVEGINAGRCILGGLTVMRFDEYVRANPPDFSLEIWNRGTVEKVAAGLADMSLDYTDQFGGMFLSFSFRLQFLGERSILFTVYGTYSGELSDGESLLRAPGGSCLYRWLWEVAMGLEGDGACRDDSQAGPDGAVQDGESVEKKDPS